MDLVCLTHVITARKRSLGHGNIFRSICHSVRGGVLYDVTFCLVAWSHVLSRGSLSLVPCSSWGVSVQRGLCPVGSLSTGGLCSQGSLCGRSLSRSLFGVPVGRPPKSEKRAVGILRECFLISFFKEIGTVKPVFPTLEGQSCYYCSVSLFPN